MELPVSTAFDSTLHSVESTNSADDWFRNLISTVQDKVEEERGDDRVRVAILDTGVDESNTRIRAALDENVIVECKGFPESRNPIRDMHGHGTHGASILIKVAPFVDLYVARVADNHGHLEEDELGNDYLHIAKAIDWAVERKVHIISISWGMKRDIPSITESITNAIQKGIVIFASASNAGANFRIPFPARLPRVFCIGSADGLGAQSNFSPPFPGMEKYSTLGEAVSGAAAKALSHLPEYDRDKEEIRRDGTSIAAPIAAGIGALLICYTRQFLPRGRAADTYENMRKLFITMSKATDGKDYQYLAPWDLFDTDEPQDYIKKILSAPAEQNKSWVKMTLLDAKTLFAVGNACNEEAQYGQAISCYQQALEIFDRDLDVDPILKADTLDRLGQACYFQGHYIDSLSSHEQALALVGRETYKAAQIFPRIVSVYIAQGDYEKAIATSKHALALCDTQISSYRAYSLRNLGEAYLLTRCLEDSFPCFEKALKFYRASIGEWNQWTARAITLIGKYHHYQNDFTKAESYFDLAIRIMSRLFGKMHIGSVVTLEAYSEFLVDTQRAPQAIDMLQQILGLYRDAVGEANLRSTRALHSLGRGYAKVEISAQAVSHYLQALEIIELHYGRDYNAEAGHIMRDLAMAYKAMGQKHKAIEMLRQAFALLTKYFGASHVFTTEVRNELSE